MNKQILIKSISFLILAATHSVAAESPSLNNTYYKGIFIGVKTGFQQAQDDVASNTPSTASYGLFGGYQINDNWSWDLGFQSSDSLDKGNVSVGTSFIESAMKYRYFFNDSYWAVYGRLGIARWDMEKTTSLTSDSDTGFSPLLEGGVTYAITPQWHSSLGYQYIDGIGDEDTIGTYDGHSVMLSLTYQFGLSKPSKDELEKQRQAAERETRLKEEMRLTQLQKANNETQQAKQEAEALKKQLAEAESRRLAAENELKKANALDDNLNVLKAKKITVRFAKGSSVLLKEDKAQVNIDLKEVAQLMKKLPNSEAYFIGHTDASGSAQYNLWMSKRRANVIAQQLKLQGINNSRIHVKGMGEINATGANSIQDRRVDIVITCDNCQIEEK